MKLSPSRRLESIGGYAFAEVDRIVADLRARGVTPIDFGVGDPTAPTPEIVRRAGQAGIDARATSGYPSYVGDGGYLAACAAWIERRFGVRLDPGTEVSSTIGSKEAVFHLPEGFVNPKDVVLGPNPGYPPYSRGTLFAEGEYVPYPLEKESGFLPDLGAIPEEVAERAKILWICYPNSPTGAVAPLSFLEEAVKWCRKRDVLLASDEAYSEIYFTDEPPHSALEFGTEGVLAIFSHSKRSAMTGWRIGFVAGDARAVEIFRKVKTNIDSGTPTFVQDAAVAALRDEDHVARFREEYRRKRDLVAGAFRDLGLCDSTPQATLYVWQRIPEGMTSVDFAKRLLDPATAIVTTPGSWLGQEVGGVNPGEGYIRLALVPSIEDCEQAAARIRALDL